MESITDQIVMQIDGEHQLNKTKSEKKIYYNPTLLNINTKRCKSADQFNLPNNRMDRF